MILGWKKWGLNIMCALCIPTYFTVRKKKRDTKKENKEINAKKIK